MLWEHQRDFGKLKEAVDCFDRGTATELCQQLIESVRLQPGAYPAREAKEILSTLRRKRLFDLAARVAESFLQSGQRSPLIYRQQVQALIENGALITAQQMLPGLISELESRLPSQPETDRQGIEDEIRELRGLQGRVHKQLFVNAAAYGRLAKNELNQAIGCYFSVFQQDPKASLWHGINSVALICRAQRDGLEAKKWPNPKELAKTILGYVKEIDAGGNPSAWDYATAMEACLALENYREAQYWFLCYLGEVETSPDTAADAFELGSTHRQLKEVWQLQVTTDPGRILLPRLYDHLMKKQGAEVLVDPPEVAATLPRESLPEEMKQGYEKVFGPDTFVPREWMERALGLCQYVARIWDLDKNPVGTGFLMHRQHLCDRMADGWYLITNCHVISQFPDSQRPRPLAPRQALVEFQGAGDNQFLKVEGVCWESPVNALDACVVRLEQTPTRDLSPVCLRNMPPDQKDRLFIIGHPGGKNLQYSIHDNRFLACKDPLLHYRTPTQGGSSGSPVFDDKWRLVALHHRGDWRMDRIDGQAGTYQANEGILLSAICKAMAAGYSGK